MSVVLPSAAGATTAAQPRPAARYGPRPSSAGCLIRHLISSAGAIGNRGWARPRRRRDLYTSAGPIYSSHSMLVHTFVPPGATPPSWGYEETALERRLVSRFRELRKASSRVWPSRPPHTSTIAAACFAGEVRTFVDERVHKRHKDAVLHALHADAFFVLSPFTSSGQRGEGAGALPERMDDADVHRAVRGLDPVSMLVADDDQLFVRSMVSILRPRGSGPPASLLALTQRSRLSLTLSSAGLARGEARGAVGSRAGLP